MNKLIKINYFGVRYEDKFVVSKFTNELTSLLRLDTITQIDVDSYTVKNTDIKLYRIVTSSIVGHGINGVDARDFYVTEDSYNKIVSKFEII